MFGFSLDPKTFRIIMIAMVAIVIVTIITNGEDILGILCSAPGVLLAITFHEFAHGYAAYKLGDDTAKRQGRLSLNPLMHLDPVGTFMLLVAGFGWGKPVQVNPRNYTRKMNIDKAEAIVAIAGPIMNFILAFALLIIYYAIAKFAPQVFYSNIGAIVMLCIEIAAIINVGLGIFNLIPLPPLDGSKVIKMFLPESGKIWLERNAQICYIIFLLMFITGAAGSLILPIINIVYNGLASLAGLMF